ncbi:MAG: hypothetical protein VYB61_07405 [Verrucomicrobiota bacterium]|nr:hypothetical protein [Verrucomicrobiota bacterium]
MLKEHIPERSHAMFWHVVLPIVFGAVIYLVFRSRHLLVFSWVDLVGFGDLINSLRSQIPTSLRLPDWIIFSLPDALWMYAIGMFYLILWKGMKSPVRYIWYAIAPLLGIGGEIGQLIGFVPGTFCLVDLSLCTAVLTITVFIQTKRITHEK